MDEKEIKALRKAAEKRGITLSEWVRQALRDASRRYPDGNVSKKLAAIRAAVKHSFPAPEIERMLDEIEVGYRGDAT
jgi:hypothetical protein